MKLPKTCWMTIFLDQPVYFCAQDDIVMGMLSVRENIEFSAALRLPSSTTQSQRREKVNEVIADLGLSACANTRVRLSICFHVIMQNLKLIALYATACYMLSPICPSVCPSGWS